MTALVLTYKVTTSDYEPDGLFTAISQVAALEQAIVDKETIVNTHLKVIEQVMADLEVKNMDLVKMLQDLDNQVKDKEREAQAQQRAEQKENFTFKQANQQSQTDNAERQSRQTDKAVKDHCQKLYRKIAQKCHSDRTKDTKLHEIFLAAKEAYKHNDTQTLEMLYAEIQSQKGPTLIERMLARWSKLKRQKEELEAQQWQLEHHPLFGPYVSLNERERQRLLILINNQYRSILMGKLQVLLNKLNPVTTSFTSTVIFTWKQ